AEIIVVDDGSTDETWARAASVGARVIRNPVNGGYGLSLRRGIMAAESDIVAITDADGTYPVEDLPKLFVSVRDGVDMAVGARQGKEYRKGRFKNPARAIFRIIAEFVAGRKIPDINSGLRVMRRDTLLPYLPQTCLGFSFTTSITLILMLNGHFVTYRPIAYAPRVGSSKVRHVRDTLRTAQIMTSIIATHNPIKLAIIVDMVAVVAILLAFLAAWIFPLASAIPVVVAGGLIATLPVVFMLGCLGEVIRIQRLR
ncbi:glycosyltransferase family 2 protein, partial [Patescibacteria group bacterium]|nr:glycosyltransferase family 2 protein [Patescibacteria group bacterium]MBU1448857.1 glycosyltransferase family 2 protein [Patescibacteria group bacterium]